MQGAAGAAAAPMFGGCRIFGDSAAVRTPNYWCTWATQARTIDAVAKSGETLFPGDQGLPGCRDNLDEKTVFGKNGWARVMYPESRKNLVFLFDDGWDVDYGFNPYNHTGKFGSLELSGRRFPSITGTPAQRLTELTQRLKDLGWAGCGLWTACQCPGESWSHHEPAAKRVEDLKKKLGWCGEAGVSYLKVDWGAHDGSVEYRAMMSELRDEYCPGTMIEHALTWGVPLNGCGVEQKDGRQTLKIGTARCLGDAGFESRIGKKVWTLLKSSDVFRIYDLSSPIFYPTAIERAFLLLETAEQVGASTIINVEDVLYLAASLGCSAGIMRAPVWAEPERDVTNRHKSCGEATRLVAWQRIAPAFGARADFRTRHTELTLTDSWTFKPCDAWYKPLHGRTVPQTAPAIVTRGLVRFPEVKDAGEGVPFLTAMRHPNGALAVGALPRIDDAKGYRVPAADVYVQADATGVPVGVFGRFHTLAFDCRDKGATVYARDLSDREEHDITAKCRFEAGRLIIPGDILEKIGAEAIGDMSMPGAAVRVKG